MKLPNCPRCGDDNTELVESVLGDDDDMVMDVQCGFCRLVWVVVAPLSMFDDTPVTTDDNDLDSIPF